MLITFPGASRGGYMWLIGIGGVESTRIPMISSPVSLSALKLTNSALMPFVIVPSRCLSIIDALAVGRRDRRPRALCRSRRPSTYLGSGRRLAGPVDV